MALINQSRTHGLNLQPAPPEQPAPHSNRQTFRMALPVGPGGVTPGAASITGAIRDASPALQAGTDRSSPSPWHSSPFSPSRVQRLRPRAIGHLPDDRGGHGVLAVERRHLAPGHDHQHQGDGQVLEPADRKPDLHSPVGSAGDHQCDTFTVDEGTTAVETLTAEDQDSAAADLEWSKAGGADADQFMLSTSGSVLPAGLVDEAPTVVRGPYLQSGTSSSVIIKWRTDVATDSLVRYGLGHDPDSLTLSATNSTPTTRARSAAHGLVRRRQVLLFRGQLIGPAAGRGTAIISSSPLPPPARPSRRESGSSEIPAPPTGMPEPVRDAFLNFTESRDPDLWIMLATTPITTEPIMSTRGRFSIPTRTCCPRRCSGRPSETMTATQPTPPPKVVPITTSFPFLRNGEAGGVASGTEAYYSFDYGNMHFICLDSYETDRCGTGR